MRKMVLVGILSVVLVSLMLIPTITGYFAYSEDVFDGENILVLGYCPTMNIYAQELALDNNLKLKEFVSASVVLSELRADRVDIALIGRKAESVEFVGNELFLGEGYTLIGNQKSLIFYRDLENLEIGTYLSEEEVLDNFPELSSVIYYSNLEDAILSSELVLINWNDWRNNFELVIPIDMNNNKVSKYRVPILYSKNVDLNSFLI